MRRCRAAASAACRVALAGAALAGCATPPSEPDAPSAAELARVTLPDGAGTIASIVMATPELSTLAAALVQSGLDAPLEEASAEFTLFAPTDAAFSVLPDALVERLMLDANRDALAGLVTSSMLDTAVGDADLRSALRRGGGRWNLSNARGTTLGLLSVPAVADADGDGAESDIGVESSIALVDGDIGGTGGGTGGGAVGGAVGEAGGGTIGAATDGAAAPAPAGPGSAAEAAGAAGLADVVVELVGGGRARVVRADIEAVNGVVHVIDAVLVPRASLR